MIHNEHRRTVRATPGRAAFLLDEIAEPGNAYWPSDRLASPADGPPAGRRRHRRARPRPVLVHGLRTGTAGGVHLRARHRGIGTHTFDVLDGPTRDTCVLRHVISGRTHGLGVLAWPLAIRWLHDAVLEEMLDRAAVVLGDPPATPARWSPYVRLLRMAAGRALRDRIRH